MGAFAFALGTAVVSTSNGRKCILPLYSTCRSRRRSVRLRYDAFARASAHCVEWGVHVNVPIVRLVQLASLRARFIDVASSQGRAAAAPPLTVVLFHGFGAPGDDLVPLAEEFGAPPGTRFVFMEAPLSLDEMPDGGRAWWPIDFDRLQFAMMSGQIAAYLDQAPDGLDDARRAVIEALDALEREHGAVATRTVIGGFSQGAMLALDVALRTTRPLAGLILLSGAILCASEWRLLMPKRRGLRVLQSHGTGDPLLLFPIAEALRDMMQQGGLEVDWVPFHGGHTIGVEALAKMGGFLDSLAPRSG